MESFRFDRIARATAHRFPRRALPGLAGSLAAGLGQIADAKAKKKKACHSGLKRCQNRCTDLATDAANCGTCGTACPTGASCTDGTCACGGDRVACGNSCVSLHDDPGNCGRCDTTCPAEALCIDGRCSCPSGQEACADECADLDSDDRHCGDCDNPCDDDQSCVDGACLTEECVIGCGDGRLCCLGRCASVTFNRFNCGGCGIACRAAESCCSGTCVNLDRSTENCGACGWACSGDTLCCGGECRNVLVDETNCGRCGRSCAAGQSCCNGKCRDLAADPDNCGACGSTCPAGWSCCAGHCRALQTDIANCGSCGTMCGFNQACAAGHCRPVTGYALADFWSGGEGPAFLFADATELTTQSGLLYVSDAGQKAIVAVDVSGVQVSTTPTAFAPDALGVAPNGTVVAIDNTRGDAEVVRMQVGGAVVTRWRTSGGASATLLDLIVDDDGFVFVSDSGSDTVQVFRLDGTPVRSWPTVQGTPGTRSIPYGLATDRQGNVFVVEGRGRIQKFGRDGSFKNAWLSPSGLDDIRQVCADRDGSVLAIDTSRDKLEKFAPDGTSLFVLSLPRPAGATSGNQLLPEDIAVADDLTVYVSSSLGWVMVLTPTLGPPTDGSTAALHAAKQRHKRKPRRNPGPNR